METSVRSEAPARHRLNLEDVTPVMAKADLKKIETPWKERVGHAVERVFKLANVTQKEAAGMLERDQAQIARWISGAERPQFDALLAVDAFQQPVLIAFAELIRAGVRIRTTVEIERVA